MMKRLLKRIYVGVFLSCILALGSQGTLQAQEDVTKILWGIGDNLGAAGNNPLVQDAGVKLLSHWYNKPADKDYLPKNSSTYYANGYAIQLIVWLAEHSAYALSSEFLEDIQEIATLLKGGPLYVVLFTEIETHPEADKDDLALQFIAAANIIRTVCGADAKVGLGLGGYHWPEKVPGTRNLARWEAAIAASDFTCTQQMQSYKNWEQLTGKTRNAVRQLGTYGKPVMISHFKIWSGGPDNNPDPYAKKVADAQGAFDSFMDEMFTESSLASLYADGLRAWVFMDDEYIRNHAVTKIPGTQNSLMTFDPVYQRAVDIISEHNSTDLVLLPGDNPPPLVVGESDLLVSYNFDDGTFAPTITPGANVTAEPVTNGDGLTFKIASVAGDPHAASGGQWIRENADGPTTIGNSISNVILANNDYIEFTIAPEDLYTLLIDSLTFDMQGRTGVVGTNYGTSTTMNYGVALYRYSNSTPTLISNKDINGQNIITTTPGQVGVDAWKTITIDVNIIVETEESVTFRLYFWRQDVGFSNRSERWLELDNINVYGALATEASNFPPSINVNDQTVPYDTGVDIEFTVSDSETIAEELIIVSVVSDDQSVVPDTNISFIPPDVYGNCIATITPLKSGIANITITVEDEEGLQTVKTFKLTARVIITAIGEALSEDLFADYIAGTPLAVPVRNGYRFDGWYLNDDFSGSPVTSVTHHSTIYAKWSELLTIPLVSYDFDDGTFAPVIAPGANATALNIANNVLSGNNNVTFMIATEAGDPHAVDGGKWIRDHGQLGDHINATTEQQTVMGTGNANDYIWFTVSPATLYTLSLDSLTFDIQGRTGSGLGGGAGDIIYSAALYCSKTGFTNTGQRLGSEVIATAQGTINTADGWKTIKIPLDHLSFTTDEPVEFRIYVWRNAPSAITNRELRWLELDNIRVYGLSDAEAAPSITGIANQTVPYGTSKEIEFIVSDNETDAENLIVSAVSDNQAVVPNGNILLTAPDAGGNCSATITPLIGGIAHITITVEDENGFTTSVTFKLTATLTVTAVGDGVSNALFDDYVAGDALPIPPKRAGYRFDGWYLASDFSGSPEISVSSNCTLYAKWTEIVSLAIVSYPFDNNADNATTFAPIISQYADVNASYLTNNNTHVTFEMTTPDSPNLYGQINNTGKWIRDHGNGSAHINAGSENMALTGQGAAGGVTNTIDYISFTLTSAGEKPNFDKLTFDIQARTGAFPVAGGTLIYHAALYSDIKGFTAGAYHAPPVSVSANAANSVSGWTTVEINLETLDMGTAGTVEFRLYFWRGTTDPNDGRDQRWVEIDNIQLYAVIDKSLIPDITWTGATDTDWETASNWTPEIVPTAINDVVIPAGKPGYPALIKNTTVGNLTIEQGAEIELDDYKLSAQSIRVKTIVKNSSQWYPIGFPFDVIVYSDDSNANLTAPLDFGLKDYNGTKFNETTAIEANTGYIIQLPSGFGSNAKISYISGNVANLEKGVLNFTSGFYNLQANPTLAPYSINVSELSPNEYVYKLNGDGTAYELITGTDVIAPFESVITFLSAGIQAAAKIVLNPDVITDVKDRTNDVLVASRYYNLQGVEVAQPQAGQIYIVKSIYESGETEVTKQIK